MNNYFASIFTVDDGKLPLFNQRVKNDGLMSHVDFSSCDIAKVIANLKNRRTVDPHGLNNIFIKCLRFVLAKPLSMICSYIFSTGTIPDAWRTANITPVHKKGVSSHVTNYRPISLTSLFCKIFTARRYAKRGICHRRVSVCLSVSMCVCLSHSGIVSKWLNVGSRK